MKPVTRVRSVRLPDVLWEQLSAVAEAREVTVSTVIVWALADFVKDGKPWETR